VSKIPCPGQRFHPYCLAHFYLIKEENYAAVDAIPTWSKISKEREAR
jgi:hypothetical protein